MTYATAGQAGTDVDGDGLPDDWEVGNGTDCTSGDDAAGDADGDQRTAWEEYVAGTNPTNGGNFQRLEIGPGGISNGWKISFASVTGRIYRVEVATNLAPAEWQPLATNLSGTSAWQDVIDTNPASPRYFRNTVELAP